jgi:hypothetical protein
MNEPQKRRKLVDGKWEDSRVRLSEIEPEGVLPMPYRK